MTSEERKERNVSGDLKHKEMMAEDNERKWLEFLTHTHTHVGFSVHEQD